MDKKGSLLLVFIVIATFVVASYFIVFKTGFNIYSEQGAGSYALDYGCTSNDNCSACLECVESTCQYIVNLSVDTGVCDTTNINGGCSTIPCHCDGGGSCLGRINPTLTIDSSPSWAEVFGTETSVTGAGCLAGLTCGLKRGGGSVSNPDIQTLNAGNHSYNYSTAGNDLYNAASTSNDLSITGATALGALTGTGTFEYNHSTNVAGTESNNQDADVLYKLYRDGVEVSNPDTTALNVGTYNYIYNSTEGQNYSSSLSLVSGALIIIKNSSTTLSLTITPSNSETSGTETTATAFGCPSQLTCTLAIDGTPVSNPDVQTLAVGTYDYNYSTPGNENYSATSIFNTLTISEVSSSSCGDGTCDTNESCSSCSQDCGSCSSGSPLPVCGNNLTESHEECDGTDNAVCVADGKVCNSNCECVILPEIAVCGDGIKSTTEQCDDGNLNNNDSCSVLCLIEQVQVAVCGNGVLDNNEQCDDRNLVNEDGCSSDCEIEEQEIIGQICGPWKQQDSNIIFATLGEIPFIGKYFKNPYFDRICNHKLYNEQGELETIEVLEVVKGDDLQEIPETEIEVSLDDGCCTSFVGHFPFSKKVSRDCYLEDGTIFTQVAKKLEINNKNIPGYCGNIGSLGEQGLAGEFNCCEATPSPTPDKTESGFTIYVVKKGDTLSGIAKKYKVTINEIKDEKGNDIKNPNKISIGQKLRIYKKTPATPPTTKPTTQCVTPIVLTAVQKELVAAVLALEAGGEGSSGMQAVMNVIQNRAKSSGKSFYDEVKKPSQFSCLNGVSDATAIARAKSQFPGQWNTAPGFVDSALKNCLVDLTNSANYYFNPFLVLPSWAKGMTKTVNGTTIGKGNHDFYRGIYK